MYSSSVTQASSESEILLYADLGFDLIINDQAKVIDDQAKVIDNQA